MRHMLAVLALCAVAMNANASSVIVVREPTFLIFGADSKKVSRDRAESYSVCKIGVAGNIYWAEAGIMDSSDFGFSIHQSAEKSMWIGGTMDDKVSNFEQTVSISLSNILNELLLEDRGQYITRYDRQSASVVIFGMFTKSIPHLYAIEFVPTLTGIPERVIVQAKRTDVPNPINPEHVFIFAGRHEVIDSAVADDPKLKARIPLVATVRKLIEMEIGAVPAEVGRPISIVVIHKDGARWVSRGNCTK